MSEHLIQHYRQRTELALRERLPDSKTMPQRLHAAMRYSVLNGGKRLRSILVYASGATLGVPLAQLDAVAAAVEMIHAYSLIHDDLPAMDNDDLRRGLPTCHIEFDEATAILAGDALQALAFEILVHDQTLTIDAATRLRLIEALAQAIGSLGMAGGQALDLAAVGTQLSLEQLETMHRLKTGALIRASLRMGALCQPQISDPILTALDRYADCLGLAFQIQDDILDVTSDTATLGKRQGADQALHKPTYPSILGLDSARKHALKQRDSALKHLTATGIQADFLAWLVAYVVNRDH
ncbi:MAG: (2E,6E)-farnesyl diphosphate synthase [Gammaproteobacteria bacterium]